MRRLLLILPFALALAPVIRADEASDILDRALKAHAKDPADLKKFRVHTMKAKGLSKHGPKPEAATWEVAAVWPGEMRLTWEFGVGDRKSTYTVAMSGDRGWIGGPGSPAEDLGIEKFNDVRTDAYALWVATLTTLKDAETKLAAAGRAKVDEVPVVGLKVSRRPWPDITLYFDEKSGLLRKMAYRSRENGVFMNKEFVYDGHKDIGGLVVPTKERMSIQGREVAEWTEVEYAFPDKLDPKIFDKPK